MINQETLKKLEALKTSTGKTVITTNFIAKTLRVQLRVGGFIELRVYGLGIELPVGIHPKHEGFQFLFDKPIYTKLAKAEAFTANLDILTRALTSILGEDFVIEGSDDDGEDALEALIGAY